MLFQNRADAGRQLAAQLRTYANQPNAIVLALPRGGVPVAYEVARALNLPLDVFVVRKLGVPGAEETAMGAIATGGVQFINAELVRLLRVPHVAIDQVTAAEQRELERREQAYRNGRPAPDLRDRTIILVDDGLATGATMQVAVNALKEQHPAKIVVAVPVAATEVCQSFREQVDDVVCVETPKPFYAVGLWYDEFSQTTDQDVRDLLSRAAPQDLEVAGGDRPR